MLPDSSSCCFYDRHIVTVAPGLALLSDAVITSAVLAADRGALIPEELAGGAGAEAGGAGAGGFEFGVDPTLDPELAMVSLTNNLLC